MTGLAAARKHVAHCELQLKRAQRVNNLRSPRCIKIIRRAEADLRLARQCEEHAEAIRKLKEQLDEHRGRS